VTTSKDLSFGQADELIQVYEHFAIKAGLWSRDGYGDKHEKLFDRIGMATPSQLRMVEGIWTEMYPEPDDKRRETALRHYLFRFFKVSDLRFLDGETVNKVLHALKQMKARKERTATRPVGRTIDPKTGTEHAEDRQPLNLTSFNAVTEEIWLWPRPTKKARKRRGTKN
jgi:hypothetical protein